jgi:hypothetical protein
MDNQSRERWQVDDVSDELEHLRDTKYFFHCAIRCGEQRSAVRAVINDHNFELYWRGNGKLNNYEWSDADAKERETLKLRIKNTVNLRLMKGCGTAWDPTAEIPITASELMRNEDI